MSDNRVNQLVQASFRGIPFRVRDEVLVEGGRKIVLHEYVNSSERFVEDLGEIPPRFRVRAFVHGSNFKALAQRLETSLKREGSGKLFLPTFGSVNVFALPYRKDASQQSVGEISFDLEFAVGRPTAGPAVSTVDVQQVYTLGDTARQVIQDIFGDLFVIPTQADNVSVAEFDITASIDSIFENYKDILPIENLSNVVSKIERVKSGLSQLIRDPKALARELIGGTSEDPGLWQEISLGLLDGEGLTNLVLSTVFGAGDILNLSSVNGSSTVNNLIDISESAVAIWNETTGQRIIRNNNRLNTVNMHRVAAMVGTYEVAADTTYATQSEIISVRQTLEAIHERIMRDDTIDRALIQSDDDVRRAVENVRLASLNVLEQKEQEVYVLSETEIAAPSSSFVQSYNLYAEEFTNDVQLADRAVLLRKLNPELPAISLDGEVTIFRTQ